MSLFAWSACVHQPARRVPAIQFHGWRTRHDGALRTITNRHYEAGRLWLYGKFGYYRANSHHVPDAFVQTVTCPVHLRLSSASGRACPK